MVNVLTQKVNDIPATIEEDDVESKNETDDAGEANILLATSFYGEPHTDIALNAPKQESWSCHRRHKK